MIIQNLEELLKEKTVEVANPILLYAIVLSESKKLRDDCQRYTVSQVSANNEDWVGLEMQVLQESSDAQTYKSLTIVSDSSLDRFKIKLVYYDPLEVKAFNPPV